MFRRQLLACLACFLVAASAQAQVPLGQPFDLAVGASTEVGPDGFVVGFTGILSDSRCPIGAICGWEGDAATSLWAAVPGEGPVEVVLHTFLNGEHQADFGPYRLLLLQVLPVPHVDDVEPIDPASYVAQLMVVPSGLVPRERVIWGSLRARYD